MATLRQKRLAQIIEEHVNNGKSLNMYKIMKEAGYSEHYARNPSQITQTKSFSGLLSESLNDEELVRKHRSLLDAYKLQKLRFSNNITQEKLEEVAKNTYSTIVTVIPGKTFTEVLFAVPDYNIIANALDKVFRITGKYNLENQRMEREFEHLSDEELDAIIAGGR